MEHTLKKTVLIAEEFAVGQSAQQIFDRLLMGYPRDGRIHRFPSGTLVGWLPGFADWKELDFRNRDFKLIRETQPAGALAGADAIIIVPRDMANATLVRTVLEFMPMDASAFVYGALAKSAVNAQQLIGLAKSRRISLTAATSTSTAWHLPDVTVPENAGIKSATIIVQGPFPTAELDALDALMTLVARRKGGETGIRQVARLTKDHIADYVRRQAPCALSSGIDISKWDPAAAAISRSDSPQGDPVRDGRTQDLYALNLISKLALNPRGWIIEHNDGLDSRIFVLDGVVADYNFAIEIGDRQIISAQIFRPPGPQQEHFSNLVAAIEDFFRTGKSPWPQSNNLLIPSLLEMFEKAM